MESRRASRRVGRYGDKGEVRATIGFVIDGDVGEDLPFAETDMVSMEGVDCGLRRIAIVLKTSKDATCPSRCVGYVEIRWKEQATGQWLIRHQLRRALLVDSC